MGGTFQPVTQNWLDTKDLLLDVLMQGYKSMGFGVEQIKAAPVDDSHPTLNFQRAFSEAMKPRPLLTVARRNAHAVPRWLGNLGLVPATTDQSGNLIPPDLGTPSIPLEETFRVRVESTDQTGGLPTVDWLLELASIILLNSYETLVWPTEAGGYGLYFVRWALADDRDRPFTEVGGKIIFFNDLNVTATRFVSLPPPTVTPSPAGFAIDVSVVTAPAEVPVDVGTLG
jgi:hypothetical protein